jgi:hypothetical protein
MSRFETPPRCRASELCVVDAAGRGDLEVRFRACESGNDLGRLVVRRDTPLREVASSLKTCFTTRSCFQIALRRGEIVYEEADV